LKPPNVLVPTVLALAAVAPACGSDTSSSSSAPAANDGASPPTAIEDQEAGSDSPFKATDGNTASASDGANVDAPTSPVINPNAFYVSPSGSDGNAGTLAAPFKTLTQAKAAMRASSTNKTAYLRSGTYPLSATLSLGVADNGETWQTYPSDPVDSAVLDGGSAQGVNGIVINGGSNITIAGMTFQNVDVYGVGIHGGMSDSGGCCGPVEFTATGKASGNTVVNNLIHDVLNTTKIYANSAGIEAFEDIPQTTIANNAVFRSAVMGIKTGSQTTGGIDDLLIANNVVYEQGTQTDSGNNGDTGAIYVQTYNGATPSNLSNNIRIENNFMRDWCGGRGVYLDNNTENVSVTGNVIGPPMASCLGNALGVPAALFFDSAMNSSVSGNIIDLGASARLYVAAMDNYPNGDQTSGNAITSNIIICNFPSSNATTTGGWGQGGSGAYAGNGSGPETIRNNVYFNYGGGAAATSANGTGNGDTNPVTEDPQISGWSYAIAAQSPVYAAPVSFPPIKAGWGPPGYVLPQSGTAPSSPH
jgi:hypothetical protein